MKQIAIVVAVATCAVAWSVAPLADEPTTAAPQADAGLSHMKVARDKDTGKLRAPTAEESAALDAKAQSYAPNVVVVRRPATTVEYRADGSAVGKRSLADMDDLTLSHATDGKAVLGHSKTAAAAGDEAAKPVPALDAPKE